MEKIARKIESFSEKTGKLISWFTLLLVLIVCLDVITRYFFQTSSVAVVELEWHLFAVIFLVGAAYTLKHDEHVRVDVLYSRFSQRTQAWINCVGVVLFLIPLCLLIIYSSKNFVFTSFQMGETSPDPGGLPARYILKAVLPLSFLLVLIQGVALLFKSILKIKEIQSTND